MKRPRGAGSSVKAENVVEAMRDFINTVQCKEESPVKDEILDVKIESGMDTNTGARRAWLNSLVGRKNLVSI